MKITGMIAIPGGLRFRIMLPAVVFILIFSLLFLVLNNYYTSQLLDKRLEREAVRISKILYESRFVLNNIYLNRLGKVIEGRIAVFDSSNTIIAASFDKETSNEFLLYVNPDQIRNRHTRDRLDQMVMKIDKAGKSFLLVSRKLYFDDVKQSILIAILTPLDDLQAAKSQIALRTILSGALALMIAFMAANLVLKKITTSVRQILTVTHKIASGDFNCKVTLPDISELKTLAASINQMSDKLMEYEKKLIDSTRLMSAGKITAAMAHEIKNPLSSIKMLTQLIEKKIEHDPDGAQMSAALVKEINRVDNLVSDLRSLSGSPRFAFALTAPQIVIEEVIMVIKPKLDHLNINLISRIESDMSQILMDKDKIKQVLWNLMMNGAQSMPNGGNLEICLKDSDKKGYIEYCIKDTGSGIDPKDMDNIFTPFFTTKKEGIGIGLYVSQEIARAHEGELIISSTNQGTFARILIPCKTQEELHDQYSYRG